MRNVIKNREFAKEIGLDTLQRNRFIKAVTALQNQTNSNTNHIQTDNYQQETAQLIESLQCAFKTVDEAVILCKNDANKKLNEMIEQLTIMQTKILKDIDENGENQKNKISQQMQIIIDARMSSKQLDYTQIKELESMVASSTNYKIEFKHNQKAANDLLSSMHIEASGLPQGAVIIVDQSKVTANSIQIQWEMNGDSSITEYELQYAKWRKIGSPKVQKSKSKKHKKRKRKYESSSSEESSSSSSSESDSQSDTDYDEGDDEKEREQIESAAIDVDGLQFKSVSFKNSERMAKKNSYKLKKLSRGYCYVLRLRSKNDFGWSEWSECVKVITKSDSKWQFQENEWLWKDFDAVTSKKIQKAMDRGKKKCAFRILKIGQEYVINFRSMEQTNIKTRKVRKVRIAFK